MSNLERYDLVGDYDLSLAPMADGDYVRYADAIAAIDAARTEAATEMLEQAEAVARDPATPHEQVWEACDIPDAVRNGIADAIAALSPIPNFKERIRRKALSDAADAVPTTWLDELLSGKNAILQGEGCTWGCPDIERLLQAVRERIIALKCGEVPKR